MVLEPSRATMATCNSGGRSTPWPVPWLNKYFRKFGRSRDQIFRSRSDAQMPQRGSTNSRLILRQLTFSRNWRKSRRKLSPSPTSPALAARRSSSTLTILAPSPCPTFAAPRPVNPR